jgi:hypothetical protein
MSAIVSPFGIGYAGKGRSRIGSYPTLADCSTEKIPV